MMKKLGAALLVAGMIVAVVGHVSKDSTVQAQPAGAAPTTKPNELVLDLGDKVTLKLVQIPAGKFLMGSPRDEKARHDNEGVLPGQRVNGNTQIEVTIAKPFYMGVYEVTVDQYAQFVKDTNQKHVEPGFWQAGNHPVVNVSWDDAHAYCQWLSEKAGKKIVLPTEAQWEYACRAGNKTRFSCGDKDEDLGDYAWYADNSKNKGAKMTHPVGQKKPNAWGLYDMHGNVFEWCADFYADFYPVAGADPSLVNGELIGPAPATRPKTQATLSDDQIKALIARLGDTDFGVREAAGQELSKAGRAVLPALRLAAKSDDPQVVASSEVLQARIEQANPEDYTLRVLRGGASPSNPGSCRSAFRVKALHNQRSDTFGFRVAVAAGVD